MTVQSRDSTRTAAPVRHGHSKPAAPGGNTLPRAGERRGSGSAVAVVLALPRWARILGGSAVLLAALFAVGVPLASLLAVGGCLAMHLFMGHGMSHGGGHAGHGRTQTDGDRESPAIDGGDSRSRGES